jgi:hypothetical protein
MRNHVAIGLIGTALSLGGIAACGDLNFASDLEGGGFGGSFSGSGPGQGGGFADTGPGAGGGIEDDSFNYTDHCGDPFVCVPGTAEAASCTPANEGGAGGTGGAGGGGGFGGSTGGAGGAGGSVPDIPIPDCRLGVNDFGDAEPTCLQTPPTGVGDIGGSCLRTADCGVGLACVRTGDGDNKTCRPYCCGDVEACPDQSYCALAPVATLDLPDGVTTAPRIPVCVEADDCQLGMACASPDETCTVVRLMGEVTSCIEPGDGLHGDPCPCAEGHFCDTSRNQCLQLCKLNEPGACSPGFSCQGGSVAVPDDWGTCVETY